MTRYAFDADRNALVAIWATGRGDLAETVALLPSTTPELATDLASNLTTLSRFHWRTYTHPAAAAGDPDIPDSEAWRRAEERRNFTEVENGLRNPNLPTEAGLLVSYSGVVESAHRVGRCLHGIRTDELTETIVAEIHREQAAIEAAELGDLSGRARQAVELSRPDVSPAQVHAADTLLRTDPLGAPELFTDLDPASASVAAAHWLHAAAEVAGELADLPITDVIAEADDIEAIPVETPTLVLERLDSGETATDIVTDLIAEAVAVSEGHLPAPWAVVARVAELEEHAHRYDVDKATRAALLAEFRVSRLDPARPALDLLEDLLDGIRGCLLLYAAHHDDDTDIEDRFAADVRYAADNHSERLF
ncbi:hypothetical protein APR12_003306 [Nocardia amikacinitolerans]|uniref:hypothetical protein n=1 Tax=Nocardia amikacinitolerans TaxID=756689 RepID=UPI0009FEEDB8|nr:hypothetical protein [Nocardia amikacinitolerans]MCP2317953.1 hypothetical protein [Nocardia amikacinitolerans]